MASERSVSNELRAAGCCDDEIALLLLVERTARRRERARRARRAVRAVGAALGRLVALPAALLLPSR